MNFEKCDKCGSNEIYYYMIQGWTCGECKKEFGHNETFDKERTEEKIQSLMMELHETREIHVSNGSQGESVGRHIEKLCHENEDYSQDYIKSKLVEFLK